MPVLHCIVLFQKKNQTGVVGGVGGKGGRGVDDMEFSRVASKEKTWNFQGLIKKEMEFSKVTKKK